MGNDCCAPRNRQEGEQLGYKKDFSKLVNKKTGAKCCDQWSDVRVDDDMVGEVCPEYCTLEWNDEPRTRAPFYSSKRAQCDICKGIITDVTQGYAICEMGHTECDYDCCIACFKGEMPEGFTLGITCGKKHALEFSKTSKSRPSGSGCDVSCDICKKKVRSIWEDGYYTCKENCDYDCCKECFKGQK